MIAGWYDREGARKVLLSTSIEAAFLPHYLQTLARDTAAVKLGAAAAVAVMMQGLQAFGVVFFAALAFWCCDMLLGIASTLSDPDKKFSPAKLGDGVLKLVVLFVVPPMIAILEALPADAFGIDMGMRPTIGVTAIIALDFLLSALENAVFIMPKLDRVRGMIVQWGPDESPSRERSQVFIVDDDDEDDVGSGSW